MNQLHREDGVVIAAKHTDNPADEHGRRVYTLSNPPTQAEIEALGMALAPRMPHMLTLLRWHIENEEARHPHDSTDSTPVQRVNIPILESA